MLARNRRFVAAALLCALAGGAFAWAALALFAARIAPLVSGARLMARSD